jgi:hypothetical protein
LSKRRKIVLLGVGVLVICAALLALGRPPQVQLSLLEGLEPTICDKTDAEWLTPSHQIVAASTETCMFKVNKPFDEVARLATDELGVTWKKETGLDNFVIFTRDEYMIWISDDFSEGVLVQVDKTTPLDLIAYAKWRLGALKRL